MPPRSRQTRHQDAASRSRQGQVIDLDPTDGLPVQRYGLQKVRINQDASNDPASTNAKSTTSAEWAAQFNTPQHPWPERPLPSYFHQLPPWNQEMIRRARAGNTNPILSTYDRKTNSWISGAEQERKLAAAKLNTLNISDSTEKPRNGDDADSSKSGDESGEDSSNEESKSADEEEFDGDETTPFKPSSAKRRKVSSRQNGSEDARIIEVTRWVPLQPSQADKAHDRNFLAPRRPGMPALYNADYAQRMFGQYLSSANLTGTSGYDLGEGGGLSNASGVLAAGTTEAGVATPPRKNIPPRRKKKKLGGPGRKKANPNPVPVDGANLNQNSTANAAGQGAGVDAMEGVEGDQGQASSSTNQHLGADDINNYDGAQDDGDNESDSEAEGSEEGEIDETGGITTHLQEENAAHLVTVTADPEPILVDQKIEATPIDEAQDVAEATTLEPPTATTVEPITTVVPTEATPPALTTDPEPTATVTTTDTDTEMIDTNEAVESSTIPDPEPAPEVPPTLIPTPIDPEEKEIVEENAEAITGTGSSTAPVDKETVTSVVEPITTIEEQDAPAEIPTIEIDSENAPAADAEKSEEPAQETKTSVPAPASAPTGSAEVDLLGGIDAAIDREVSEGA